MSDFESPSTLWDYVVQNLKSYKLNRHTTQEDYTKYLSFRLQNVKDIQKSLCQDPRLQELILRKDGYWVLFKLSQEQTTLEQEITNHTPSKNIEQILSFPPCIDYYLEDSEKVDPPSEDFHFDILHRCIIQ